MYIIGGSQTSADRSIYRIRGIEWSGSFKCSPDQINKVHPVCIRGFLLCRRYWFRTCQIETFVQTCVINCMVVTILVLEMFATLHATTPTKRFLLANTSRLDHRSNELPTIGTTPSSIHVFGVHQPSCTHAIYPDLTVFPVMFIFDSQTLLPWVHYTILFVNELWSQYRIKSIVVLDVKVPSSQIVTTVHPHSTHRNWARKAKQSN